MKGVASGGETFGGLGGDSAGGTAFMGNNGTVHQLLLKVGLREHTDWRSGSIFTSTSLNQPMSSESILSGESVCQSAVQIMSSINLRLSTLVTSERLDSKVDPLVSLQIVITVLIVSFILSSGRVKLTKL